MTGVKRPARKVCFRVQATLTFPHGETHKDIVVYDLDPLVQAEMLYRALIGYDPYCPGSPGSPDLKWKDMSKKYTGEHRTIIWEVEPEDCEHRGDCVGCSHHDETCFCGVLEAEDEIKKELDTEWDVPTKEWVSNEDWVDAFNLGMPWQRDFEGGEG